MRLSFTLLLLALCLGAHAQALRDINYRYEYNPDEPFHFQQQVYHTSKEWASVYSLQLRDSSAAASDYTIQWQVRNALSDKDGKSIHTDSVEEVTSKHSITGRIIIPAPVEREILVARITNVPQKKAWLIFIAIKRDYPTNNVLVKDRAPVVKDYVNINSSLSLKENEHMVVSYYSHIFPAAVPPFSEAQGRVDKKFVADSTFVINAGQSFTAAKKGLYFLQHDTTSMEGFSFRAEDDYPRLARIESLADPLVYICTREEFVRVKVAKGDKKAFDKVILGITGDPDRAKTLFRSYFRRVELANEFFTSYKEGWKTDRGMIYIIFGLPDEVYKFEDREVWNYKNDQYKLTFNFAKSATLFDPQNFVLIRDKKFQETWYSVIDLWRNARF